ncbi:MAG: hypothetical protein WCC54_00945 [Pseudolabrys sp.]|jgi:hypothetical protein
MIYEYSLSAKWLELLKQIAPGVSRVAVIRNPENPVGVALFSAIQAAAQPHRIEVSPIDSRRDAGEIERAITTFAHSPKWRFNFNTQRGVDGGWTQSDHLACRPVQAPNDLSFRLHGERGRADGLRA